ncbi:leucine-rich repeat protein 1-like [Actinidia eriantha]|uniref:leucine-rich repeat protein 1-like n=1 Tax=Actinidia eriantha TaxID=165200 RepID=UPI00258D4D7E|nr:leucine-rich repeat protein 1-like [Actinidia eriantha]
MAAPLMQLFFFAFTIFLNSKAMVCANIEVDALVVFKQGLSDPNNILASWDPNIVDPCTWIAVTCNQNNQVTRLDLVDKNLDGNLVPDLGKLEYLQYLELYENKIRGTIPVEFGNLKNLIAMDLHGNNLTGSIPSSLGNIKSLKILLLNDNHLSGQIPREVLNLPNIQILNATNNNVAGTTIVTRNGPADNIHPTSVATPSLGLLKFLFLLPVVSIFVSI